MSILIEEQLRAKLHETEQKLEVANASLLEALKVQSRLRNAIFTLTNNMENTRNFMKAHMDHAIRELYPEQKAPR